MDAGESDLGGLSGMQGGREGVVCSVVFWLVYVQPNGHLLTCPSG